MSDEQLLKLEAEVLVLREYVRGLLGLLPIEPASNGMAADISRAISARLPEMPEAQRTATARALGEFAALQHVGRLRRRSGG